MDAIPPPPGVDVSRASVVAIPTIVTVVIAVILTSLRIYVRLSILKRLEWDDFFNVLAAVSKFNAAFCLPAIKNTMLMFSAVVGHHRGTRSNSRSDGERTRTTHILPGQGSRRRQHQVSSNLRIHPYPHDCVAQDFHLLVCETIIVRPPAPIGKVWWWMWLRTGLTFIADHR